MINYSNVRYLQAKEPIDHRAINRHVLAELERELSRRATPLRVLELGAGVGTMVSRLADWGVARSAQYTLIDRDADSLTAARQHLLQWGGLATSPSGDLHIENDGASLAVKFAQGDLFDFLNAPENGRQYDLAIANAVLDLTDLAPTLPCIWKVLEPGSPFWFSINFDGETIFLPELPLDERVMHLYHASMGADAAGTRSGHSRTGRMLLQAIPASGATLLAAGSSDWVVFPQAGGYPSDEGYFLHHIVDTIRTALTAHPQLDQRAFQDWLAARHAQVDEHRLSYIAHQLDVFGCAPSADA